MAGELIEGVVEGVQRHPLAYAFWGCGIIVALTVGRSSARLAGAALLAYILFAIVYHPDELHTVFWHLAAGDMFVLPVMLTLLLRYRQAWLSFATGVAILSVLVHVPRLAGPFVRNLGYATAVTGLGYLLVTVVVIGAILERAKYDPIGGG